MRNRRLHSVLTQAGEPWVRIQIETDLWRLQWWEDARAIEPEEMEFAVLVRTARVPGDRVRVELAVDPVEYAVGIETSDGFANAYIEMLLNSQAGLILGDDEIDEETDDGQSEPPDDGIPF